VVRPRTLQRSGACRARLRPADLRDVPGIHRCYRPVRTARVWLADAALVDDAAAQPGDVHLRRGAGRHAAHPHDVTALDCRCIDRALWRDDYSDLLRRLEAGVWPGASGAHSGRGTDADGPGVGGWAAGLRAV